MGKIGDFLVDEIGGTAARYVGNRLKSMIPFAMGGKIARPSAMMRLPSQFCKGGIVRRKSYKLNRKQKRMKKQRK